MAQTKDPLRILYVDDEDINLRLMRDVFSLVLQHPEPVVTATSGEEALKILGSGAFDVVISDQRMPGMCGTVLLSRVKNLAPRAARVLLTGYPTDSEVTAALDAGVADAVVPKPWKARELQDQIHALVDRD